MTEDPDAIDEFTYSEPWFGVTDLREREAIERELRRELPRGHVLFDCIVHVVARRRDCDDVAVRMSGSEQIAVVHLTWSHEPPEQLPSPETDVYLNLQAFQVRMEADREGHG